MGKKLFILGFILLSIHAGLTVWYARVMSDSSLLKSDRYFQTLPVEMDVLVMGNSHAMSINPELWKGCYNMATSGERLHQSYYKLAHLLEEKQLKVNRVIVPCDLMTLRAEKLEHTPHQFYWNRFVNESELSKFSEKPLDFSMHRLLNTLFPYKDGEKDVMDYYFATDQSKERARERAFAKIKSLNGDETRSLTDSCLQAQISDYGRFYMDKITQLCEKHNCKLSMVRFPVTAHYFFSESECFDPEEHYQLVTNTFQIKGQSVPILDFHAAFPQSAFRDPHHLKYGAECDSMTLLLQAAIQK